MSVLATELLLESLWHKSDIGHLRDRVLGHRCLFFYFEELLHEGTFITTAALPSKVVAQVVSTFLIRDGSFVIIRALDFVDLFLIFVVWVWHTSLEWYDARGTFFHIHKWT